MDLFEEFALNEQAEVEGVWKPLTREVEVKVARVDNPEYTRVLRRKYKANQASLEAGDDLANEQQEELIKEVYAQTILKDIRSKNGEELKVDGEVVTKYTPAIGFKLLQNAPFFARIKGFAEDLNAYKLKGEEEAIKN